MPEDVLVVHFSGLRVEDAETGIFPLLIARDEDEIGHIHERDLIEPLFMRLAADLELEEDPVISEGEV